MIYCMTLKMIMKVQKEIMSLNGFMEYMNLYLKDIEDVNYFIIQKLNIFRNMYLG